PSGLGPDQRSRSSHHVGRRPRPRRRDRCEDGGAGPMLYHAETRRPEITAGSGWFALVRTANAAIEGATPTVRGAGLPVCLAETVATGAGAGAALGAHAAFGAAGMAAELAGAIDRPAGKPAAARLLSALAALFLELAALLLFLLLFRLSAEKSGAG